MGEETAISWCQHTFNGWWSCRKIGPECETCYAGVRSEGWPAFKPFFPTVEQLREAKQQGLAPDAAAPVWRTSANTWKLPRRWNRLAQARGERASVFCSSMTDVFLAHPLLDGPAGWRADLWRLIRDTPWLTWLLLTKRPDQIADRLPDDWGPDYDHVKIGVTAGAQRPADERLEALHAIRHLLRNPAFVSCEPLLERVDLERWLAVPGFIDWIITGGESQSSKDHQVRPTHPDNVLLLRDQALARGLAFHHKQWGDWIPMSELGDADLRKLKIYRDAKRYPEDYPEDMRTRICTVPELVVFPDGSTRRVDEPIAFGDGAMQVFLLGAKRTGNLLRGRTHLDLEPTPARRVS